MSVLRLFFGWPDGGVWSNLVASALCSSLVWWRLRVQAIRHHAETLAQAARHHREQMTQTQEHHDELKKVLSG